jgi:hypothetical protein
VQTKPSPTVQTKQPTVQTKPPVHAKPVQPSVPVTVKPPAK